jgi:hypothetical protein
MVAGTKAIINSTKSTVMASILGLMDAGTEDSGRLGNSTEMGSTSIRTVRLSEECGRMASGSSG